MEVKYESEWIVDMEMQPVDAHTFLHIKEQLFKRNIIFILKILAELLRLEDDLLLDKIYNDGKKCDTADDI